MTGRPGRRPRRRNPALRFGLTLVGLFVSAHAVGVHAAAESETAYLTAARIFVAPNAAPIEDGVVAIRDGKIVAVGPRNAIAIPKATRGSACNGGFIAAGFQNSHVHFTGAQFQDAGNQPGETLSRRLTESLARYGFTTVVDTASERGNTLALRSRIARGDVRGPRILTAGLPLFPPDGLPFYLAGLPKALLDQFPQPATPDAAVKAVRANLDGGADGTKLFVATPQRNRVVKRMPDSIALAAAQETHRRGKLVMAHPTDVDGIRSALAANVDIVVHTTLDDGASWPDPLIRQLVAQGVSVTPTLKLWRYELAKGNVPETAEKALVAGALAQLKAFSDAGGDVLFGTDVGYMTDADPSDEYAMMANAGLTPMQILASLTSAPASRWKESARRGRVATGMDADLVVLDADPTVDARNFAKVRCTFRGGAAIYAR